MPAITYVGIRSILTSPNCGLQMKKYLILSVLGTILLSCSDEDNENRSEFVSKTFDHLFFKTEQECIDAQPVPDFFINCHRQLHIVDDENVEIMLTDIIYSTNYTIKNNKIIIYSSSNTMEFQNDLIFEIVDPTTLKLTEDNTIWKVRIGDSIWN